MSDNGINLWNNLLEAAMKLPLVRVSRVEFLTKEIKIYKPDIDSSDIEDLRPEDILDTEYIRKIAKKLSDIILSL